MLATKKKGRTVCLNRMIDMKIQYEQQHQPTVSFDSSGKERRKKTAKINNNYLGTF